MNNGNNNNDDDTTELALSTCRVPGTVSCLLCVLFHPHNDPMR